MIEQIFLAAIISIGMISLINKVKAFCAKPGNRGHHKMGAVG